MTRGQPTVDRLAALVDAARNLIVSRNGVFSLRASNDEIRSFMAALTRAEQHLDSASPLTTPTPDQGALERARETRCEGRRIYNRERARRSLAECENQAIAAALIAAEAKGHAAALFEAECELIGYHSALRANEDRPGITDHECAIIDCAIAKVRVLATSVPKEKVMTDQGALKTEINKRVQTRYAALMQEGKHGHYETMFRVVHEERAAAASEARAAHEKTLRYILGQAGISDPAEACRQIIATCERAPATPAQSPGQKIIAGLQEALAHAKGETTARYDCGHRHNSFKEALECRLTTPAQSEGK